MNSRCLIVAFSSALILLLFFYFFYFYCFIVSLFLLPNRRLFPLVVLSPPILLLILTLLFLSCLCENLLGDSTLRRKPADYSTTPCDSCDSCHGFSIHCARKASCADIIPTVHLLHLPLLLLLPHTTLHTQLQPGAYRLSQQTASPSPAQVGPQP